MWFWVWFVGAILTFVGYMMFNTLRGNIEDNESLGGHYVWGAIYSALFFIMLPLTLLAYGLDVLIYFIQTLNDKMIAVSQDRKSKAYWSRGD